MSTRMSIVSVFIISIHFEVQQVYDTCNRLHQATRHNHQYRENRESRPLPSSTNAPLLHSYTTERDKGTICEYNSLNSFIHLSSGPSVNNSEVSCAEKYLMEYSIIINPPRTKFTLMQIIPRGFSLLGDDSHSVFENLFLVHLFLDRGGHDEAIHHDIPGLSNPICAVNGLSILGGIPTRVKYYNTVSTLSQHTLVPT
jgi:hypothetical protein